MPDQGIFCNTPWYEMHIYWDGSLGICCQENHKLYPANKKYNIATTSIREWFNSEPVRNFRLDILGQDRLTACKRCYEEEDKAGHSRRFRSNVKSVIFTRQAFAQSYQQSPGYKHFKNSEEKDGWADTLPIDLHIDLGNYCNLACKMCNPRASSTIASQQVRWGIESSRQYLGTDWTRDSQVWQNFLRQVIEIPGLQNIHFMGGETLLTDRLEQLIDFFIAHDRYDVCFSFVTNGTVYSDDLMGKMSQFARVGIEISVETMTDHNQYQRQGTDNRLLMENLNRFRKWDNGHNITVSFRPAPSILTIGYYHTLLDYAIRNQMVVKSNLCFNPAFMRAEILPREIKDLYRSRLEEWASTIKWPKITSRDFNASDPNNSLLIAHDEIEMVRSTLDKATPQDSEIYLEQLVRHCERWDRVYGLDARSLYPEFAAILERYAYTI